MPETALKKVTCVKCGVDRREGTAFCYNCGFEVVELPAAEPLSEQNGDMPIADSVAEDAMESVKIDSGESEKLARAADERKKARVGLRKTKDYAWEPTGDLRLFVLAAILITLIAIGIVFLTVFWK